MSNEITFIIYGKPRTKKNSQTICVNKETGKPFIRQNERYIEFEQLCGYQIKSKLRKRIDYPVNVKEVFYMDSRRRVDLTNLEEAIDDVLVKYGVLKDDNSTILVSHDGSRVYLGDRCPRIEITITPIKKGAQDEGRT